MGLEGWSVLQMARQLLGVGVGVGVGAGAGPSQQRKKKELHPTQNPKQRVRLFINSINKTTLNLAQ